MGVNYAATPNNLLMNFAWLTASPFGTHLALPCLTIPIASMPLSVCHAVGTLAFYAPVTLLHDVAQVLTLAQPASCPNVPSALRSSTACG